MKVWVHFVRAPIRVIVIRKKRSFIKLKKQMTELKRALSQEKIETKEMLSIYKKYTKRQANQDEMALANKQFMDILKGLGLGVFAVLPFAPITIPILIKLGKVVGVDILPSSFNKEKIEQITAKKLDE